MHHAIAIAWAAWTLYGNSVPVTQSPGELVELAMPTSSSKAVSFVTTQSDSAILGNLTGKTLSATLSLSVSGAPVFLYNYANQCSGNNFAFVRLYFTTTTGPYNLNHANSHETKYWWADFAYADLVNFENGSVTLSASLADPSQWGDALGHNGGDPAYTAAFQAAVSQVAQIGVAFGGGCFFDVGDYVKKGPGTAALHLLDYTAQ